MNNNLKKYRHIYYARHTINYEYYNNAIVHTLYTMQIINKLYNTIRWIAYTDERTRLVRDQGEKHGNQIQRKDLEGVPLNQ